MDPGTIFIWRKYKNLHNEGPKDVWGLYWGKTDSFINPVNVIFHKFTSQFHYYETYGDREKHKIFDMKKSEYSFFEAEHSIIDFTLHCQVDNEADFNSAQIDILYKLPEDKIRFLYNHIKQPYANIEYKIKCRIKENLNNSGIIGLEMPKRNIQRPY